MIINTTISLLNSIIRMRQVARMSTKKLNRLQQKRLNRLLRYAYDYSAYYKKAFENAGITRDRIGSLPISAYPTIDKDALMEHFGELVTVPGITQEELRRFDEQESLRENYPGNFHIVHSSGSTGVPRYFVYDDKAWKTMLAGILRGALWDVSWKQFFKWYTSDPRILYVAATDGRYGGAMAAFDGIDGLGVKQTSLDIGMPYSEWTKTLREFKPNFIVGYPSAVKLVAELTEKEGIELHVNRVFTCGEPLSPGLRRHLEERFQTTAVNLYGASESLALGAELSAEGGMILFDDLNLIEVTDGEMYLTCLYNKTQPLIRYRISDHLILREKRVADDAFTRAIVLLCRDDDVMWFRSKSGERDFLHPLSVEGFCLDGLLDYQFRQTSDSSFDLALQLSGKADPDSVMTKLRDGVQTVLNGKRLSYVRFDMMIVDEILPDTRTGKKQLIQTLPA